VAVRVRLSERDLDVLALMAINYSNPVIAELLISW
jgi:hypothetical protein